MIICKTPEDIYKVRHLIYTKKDMTMLWSGARHPFGQYHQDGSPKFWSERDVERLNLDKSEVGKHIVVDNYHGLEINGFIAKESGKETLNQALERLGIEVPMYDKSSEDIWQAASLIWAENAQGEVGLSSGETIQESSMFATMEFDTIKANMRVTSIVVYDNYPVTAGGGEPRTYSRKEFETMSPHELCLYWCPNNGRYKMTESNTSTVSTQLKTLSPSMGFNYGGQHWTKLFDSTDGGTLVVVNGIVDKLPFDKNNKSDWRSSSLRKRLNNAENTDGFLALLLNNGASINDFMLVKSDLVADDGMTDYGITEDFVSLISCDSYRQHRDIIPLVDDAYWTLTTWTCLPDIANFVRCVCSSGVISGCFAKDLDCGVRPICCLQSDICVSC